MVTPRRRLFQWAEAYSGIKLSSAGLVFKHFGPAVVEAICGPLDEKSKAPAAFCRAGRAPTVGWRLIYAPSARRIFRVRSSAEFEGGRGVDFAGRVMSWWSWGLSWEVGRGRSQAVKDAQQKFLGGFSNISGCASKFNALAGNTGHSSIGPIVMEQTEEGTCSVA